MGSCHRIDCWISCVCIVERIFVGFLFIVYAFIVYVSFMCVLCAALVA